LSITEQRAVGLIPAWSLAFLHYDRLSGMTLGGKFTLGGAWPQQLVVPTFTLAPSGFQ